MNLWWDYKCLYRHFWSN